MCTGYEVYKHYVALKAHFKGTFDYIKYKGKIKRSFSDYDRRNDQGWFEAIARKVDSKEVVPFLVANIMNNDDIWIGDMLEDFEGSRQIFVKWKKQMVWLYKNYEEDLINICEFAEQKDLAIQDLFMYNRGIHPLIFRFMLEGMIEKETFIILDNIIHFIEVNDKHLKGDIIWDRQITKLTQYKPFVIYDWDKCEQITNKQFKNTA